MGCFSHEFNSPTKWYVCFVKPRVLSTNRVDLGLFCYKFFNFTPPPQKTEADKKNADTQIKDLQKRVDTVENLVEEAREPSDAAVLLRNVEVEGTCGITLMEYSWPPS